MKPIPFDMTPLARAIDMPLTQKPVKPQKPAPKKTTDFVLRPAPQKAQPVQAQARAQAQPKPRPEPKAAPVAKTPEPKPVAKKPEPKPVPKREPEPKPEPAKAEKKLRRTESPVGKFPEHITSAGGWLSSLAHEQIHALATHVVAHHTEQGLRTLAVTSALAGEGKTTVSLALAEKLATADKRILVIDLDTHRGTLSYDAALDGLAGALESSVPKNGKPVAFHTYATDIAGVFIMPTGRMHATDAGSVPLLDPERIQNLVDRGTENFDLVILDCPPLLPVADARLIAEVADRAMMVVRANSTPQPIVRQALESIGDGKLMAAILNRAQPQFIPYFKEVYGYYRRSSSR